MKVKFFPIFPLIDYLPAAAEVYSQVENNFTTF
jgi:hypothetical protein